MPQAEVRPADGTGDDTGDDTGRRETRKERIDRELMELLNELRVALPGVQFLFAFLLIVPFQQITQTATGFQRDVYYVSLLSAAVSTVLLIAPAAFNRSSGARCERLAASTTALYSAAFLSGLNRIL